MSSMVGQHSTDPNPGLCLIVPRYFKVSVVLHRMTIRASFIYFGGCGLGTGVGWWWAPLLLAAQPMAERGARFRLCQPAFGSPPV